MNGLQSAGPAGSEHCRLTSGGGLEFAVLSVCRKGTGDEDMKTVAIQKFCVVAALVLLTAGVGVVGCATDQDGQAMQDTSAAPAADAGLKVYIDPETGEFLEEPLPGQADAAGAGNNRQAERAPLVEEPSPVEGGGTMIRLDDRFHAEFRATVDTDGELKADCAPSVE